jgi:hypothetical protein
MFLPTSTGPSRLNAQKRERGQPDVVGLLMMLVITGVARAETRRITLDEAVSLVTQQNSTVKMARLKTKDECTRDGSARQLFSGAQQ